MGSRSGKRATALSPLSACGAPGVEHRTRTRVLNRRGAERRTPAQAGCRARRRTPTAPPARRANAKQMSTRHGIRNDGVAAMGARIVPAKVFMPLARARSTLEPFVAASYAAPTPPLCTNGSRLRVAQRAPRSRERAARRHQSTQPVVRRRLCCAVITHSATAMQLGAPPSAVRARKLKRGKEDVQFEINAHNDRAASKCRPLSRRPRNDLRGQACDDSYAAWDGDRARAPWRASRPIFT